MVDYIFQHSDSIRIGYDANGNIETQARKDAGGNTIDNLTYRYQKAINGQLLRNRLYHVNDNVGAGAFADDIDDMGTFQTAENMINTDNNYGYDALGQLTRDEQENIIDIQWRNDGKISSILRGTGGT